MRKLNSGCQDCGIELQDSELELVSVLGKCEVLEENLFIRLDLSERLIGLFEVLKDLIHCDGVAVRPRALLD